MKQHVSMRRDITLNLIGVMLTGRGTADVSGGIPSRMPAPRLRNSSDKRKT